MCLNRSDPCRRQRLSRPRALLSSLTMKLVDALITANKDFDLLILPNENHTTPFCSPYFIRRKWDFFVRHLLGVEPPTDYAITLPENKSMRPRPSRAAICGARAGLYATEKFDE